MLIAISQTKSCCDYESVSFGVEKFVTAYSMDGCYLSLCILLYAKIVESAEGELLNLRIGNDLQWTVFISTSYNATFHK